MQELNPQVGRMLQVRLASEPFVESMICFSGPRWAAKTYRQDMYRSLAELHLEPAGRQILTIFRSTQFVPFKESHLEAVKQLRTRHDQLQKELKP